MAFGPEFIRGLRAAISTKLPWRVARVEGGESWAALKVSYGDLWLILSWGAGAAGCCLAGSGETAALKKGAPARAPITEALKSRAVRGDIVAVRQVNDDRVLEFQLRRRVAAGTAIGYYLVLEATEPVGNLLLLDEDRRIEEAARHSAPDRNRYRTLLPGHDYAPPPAFDGPLPSSLSSLAFSDVPDLAGIGRPLTRLVQSHWEERDPSTWLSALQDAVTDAPLPCQVTAKNYVTRFGILLPEAVPLGDDPLQAAARGVLAPMMRRGRDRLLHELDQRLKRAVKARERRLDGLRKQLKNCAEAEDLRRKGEALLAHLAEVPAGAGEVTLTTWEGERLTIALDARLSPSRNAERYFRRYRKGKGDPAAIRDELRAQESAISEILEQHDLLEAIDDPEAFEEALRDIEEWLAPEDRRQDAKKKKGKKGKGGERTPPFLSFAVEGLTVLVGLSARGNRYVTFKQARPEDIWMHAHELPGSHVIIRGARDRAALEGEHRAVLEFAASLAAAHSKGRNAGSVPIDYTERRHVRSVPGTIALVTYTNPGTLRAVPHAGGGLPAKPEGD
ncbi:Rqc2 RqcH [Fretibacterium fastidiosum]|uniref:Rqc2 family fibronectin-binding protein n=1 Tax=Fretibacterium fastidiosum TaxID=651822 RepID=UPI0038FC7E83